MEANGKFSYQKEYINKFIKNLSCLLLYICDLLGSVGIYSAMSFGKQRNDNEKNNFSTDDTSSGGNDGKHQKF